MTPSEAKGFSRMLRRHVALASIARVALLALVVIGLLGATVQTETDDLSDTLWFAAMFAGLVWVTLTVS